MHTLTNQSNIQEPVYELYIICAYMILRAESTAVAHTHEPISICNIHEQVSSSRTNVKRAYNACII